MSWGKSVSADFKERVRQIAVHLDIDVDFLMACIAFESGETFSASIKNRASGATGLRQFMPATARRLGTTIDLLAAMSAEAQLEFVERYFQAYAGRLRTLADVYMAILWPHAVSQPDDFVLFSEPGIAYRQNSHLDTNGDGRVTKLEAAALVNRKLVKGNEEAHRG